MNAVNDHLVLAPAPGATNDRVVSASQFEVVGAPNLNGQHILVLDDTWTTGSRAQSAALRLHEAGANYVSVMVMGRWVSPDFGNNATFISKRIERKDNPYNPRICPVTGADCP